MKPTNEQPHPNPLHRETFSRARVVAIATFVVSFTFPLSGWAVPQESDPAVPPAGKRTELSLASQVPASVPIYFEWRTMPPEAGQRAKASLVRILEDPKIRAALESLDPEGIGLDFWTDVALSPETSEARVEAGAVAIRLHGRNRGQVLPDIAWEFRTESPDALLRHLNRMVERFLPALFSSNGLPLEFRVHPLEPRTSEQADPSVEGDIPPAGAAEQSRETVRRRISYGPALPAIEIVHARTDESLFVATDASFLRQVLDPKQSPRRARRSLSKSAAFRRVDARFDTIDAGELRGFVNLHSLFVVADASLRRKLHDSGIGSVRAIGMSIHTEGEAIRERYFFDVPSPRRGLMAVARKVEGSDRAASLAHPNPLLFARLQVDPQKLIELCGAASSGSPAGSLLDFLERGVDDGSNLRESWIESFGSEVALSVRTGRLVLVPEVVLLIEARNPEGVADWLDRSIERSPQLEATRSEFLGHRITEIRQRERPSERRKDALGGSGSQLDRWLAPRFTIRDGYLMVGLSEPSLRNLIAERERARSLDSRSLFARTRESSEWSAAAGGVYVDLERFLRVAYTIASVRLVQHRATRGSDDPGVEPDPTPDLPDFSRLARYLFPLTMTLDVEPEGWYLGSRSPLGSGFLLGFAGSAGVSLYAAPGAPTVAQRTMSRAVTSEDAWKRANLALGEGKGTEALRHYSQALQLAESDRHKGALYFERGRLLAELGDDSQAIGDFDRAANLGHAPGESHFLAAAAHARQGEAAEAVSRLRRAIEAGWRQYDDLSRDRSFVTIARDPRYRTFLRSLDR